MDKRYQVFVSSTFDDLKDERQAVIQALLELDCIPSGMELFPASDEEQWTFIRRIIEDSDYFIVVIGGRYGSLGSGGKSYTQMEYEYAIDSGKPVIAFIHEDIGKLPSNRTEKTDAGKKALEEFRQLAQTKQLCKSWLSVDNLGSVVSRSMVQLMKRRPAVGWVRANLVADESAANEIVRLRRMIEQLQKQAYEASELTRSSREDLAQGDDEIELSYDAEAGNRFITTTWREVLAVVVAKLLTPCSEFSIRQGLNAFIERKLAEEYIGEFLVPIGISISQHDVDKIMLQLRALGFIEADLKRSAFGGDEYVWSLTSLGASQLAQIAVKRCDVA